MTALEHQSDHDQYEMLCALSTAGVLTPAESSTLSLHLVNCAECKAILAQYAGIAESGMAFLAEEFAVVPASVPFDEEAGLTRLMQATEADRPQIVPMP